VIQQFILQQLQNQGSHWGGADKVFTVF